MSDIEVKAEAAMAPASGHWIQRAVDSAIDKGAEGVETVRALLQLQREMRADTAKELGLRAMSGFRADMAGKSIRKNKSVNFGSGAGGHVAYSHASLDQISKTIDPVLSKHGLSYRFDTEVVDQKLMITCIVSHEAGYEFRSCFPSQIDTSGKKNAIQATGSGLTYGMRYSLVAVFGLTTADEDDDGISSGDREQRNGVITEGQYDELSGLLDKLSDENAHAAFESLLQWAKLPPDGKLQDLPSSKFGGAKRALEARSA